jgi:hypothetical protein
MRPSGHCYSAALDFLAAGSYRIASPDYVFLLHQTSRPRESLSLDGSLSD